MLGQPDRIPLKDTRAGFNLISMSILMTVAAIVLVSALPGGESGNATLRSATTVEKLMRIEKATTGFIAANGRRPCPADGQYPITDALFGIEAANPGSCIGGTPAAPRGSDIDTGNVTGGTVPTKTLGLPDSFAFDEWGRRLTYFVDKRATKTSSCGPLQNYPINNGTGDISVKDSASGNLISKVMAVYISHGPDGHGAIPAEGSTLANRISTSSTDTDTKKNAGANTFSATKVLKEKTATFDDITYYAEYQKNKCCIGGSCYMSPGFRIDGSGDERSGFILAQGDINGDGISDAVIGAPYNTHGGWRDGSVYVVFGNRATVTSPLSLSSLDGTNGFRIDGNTSGWGVTGTAVAVGDTNNDGYDDILITQSPASGGQPNAIVVFGKASWASAVNISTLQDGTKGFALTGGLSLVSYHVASGDVNNDGYADWVMGDTDGASDGKAYVVLGHSNPWGASLDLSTLNGTTGFTITGAPGNLTAGSNVAAGDINKDGFDDVLVYEAPYGGHNSSWFVVFGHASPFTATINGTTLTGADGFQILNVPSDMANGVSAVVGDVNGDGIADMAFGAGYANTNAGGASILFGKTSAWSATFDMATLNGTNGSSLNGVTNGDYAGGQGGSTIAIGDVNGDNYKDVIIGAATASPNGNSNSGSVFVYFGHGGTWSTSYNLSDLNGSSGVRINGVNANDLTGYAVSLVDINRDSKRDILIGAYNAVSNAGAGYTYVVYGRSTWSATLELSTLTP